MKSSLVPAGKLGQPGRARLAVREIYSVRRAVLRAARRGFADAGGILSAGADSCIWTSACARSQWSSSRPVGRPSISQIA